MSAKEEREFGQSVMEEILDETGEAGADSKTARSFKATGQKQKKAKDSKGLADEIKAAATSSEIGKDVQDAKVVDEASIKEKLRNDPIYQGVVVDQALPRLMSGKDAIANLINEDSVKAQMEGTAKRIKLVPEPNKFFKEEQYGDPPRVTRELALKSAGVLAHSEEEETDLNFEDASDMTDPDRMLENMKRISEQRILRQPETMREMYDQIMDY